MLKMAHTLSLLLILNVLAAMMIVTEEVSADENESVADLRVNEVADKGTSDTCDGKDWIELHNTSGAGVDLAGWRTKPEPSSAALPGPITLPHDRSRWNRTRRRPEPRTHLAQRGSH